MSFLPADILPGSASVVGMLTEAGPGAPFFAPASGGGGGGSGPNLSVSTITFAGGNQTTSGVINMSSILAVNDSSTPVGQDYIFQTNFQQVAPNDWNQISSFTSTPNVFEINGPAGNSANGQLLCFAGADASCGFASLDAVANLSKMTLLATNVTVPNNLVVSSINGAAPGGGSSLFQSTFNGITINPTASTILMEMPAGQFGYNGLVQGGGGTSLLTGYISVAVDQSGPNYFGSINDQTQAQPANSFNATMVINEGDSGLSTIKLIVANTGIATGQFTGVVSKLY